LSRGTREMPRPRTRDELEQLLAERGEAVRRAVVHVDVGKVSQAQGEIAGRDELELDTDEGPITIEMHGVGACDFNHQLENHGVQIAGRCSKCGRYVCSTEGCARTCPKCGQVFCSRHSRVTPDGAFCGSHARTRLAKKAVAGAARAVWSLVKGWFGER